MLKYFIFCSMMLLGLQISNAQSPFSKNSLKFSAGYGWSNSYNAKGKGTIYSFGYQTNIWRDRLRFNPYFALGLFKEKGEYDGIPQLFKSFKLNAEFHFDILKIKTLSIILGGGPVINYNHGFAEAGGWGGGSMPYKINDFHFGGHLNTGIRIDPKNKRFALEVLPINIILGTKGYSEVSMRIGVEYKLK